jgi:hypothetical protein
MIYKSILKSLLIVFLALQLGSCLPNADDPGNRCSDRDLLFCEDFDFLSGDLDASGILQASLYSKWWVAKDTDREFLFEDFPFDGRSREYMILLGNGGYSGNENSLLYTVEIDLGKEESAFLSYSLIYQTEEHWDGLVVFAILGGISGIGDGGNWVVLTPENGYPDTVMIGGRLFPGYSGIRSTWLNEKIDLTPVLGRKIVLAFYFASDEFQEDWGAAIDDISIQASSDLITSQAGQVIDLTELALELPEQNYLAPLIPRANITADIICEDSTAKLANGQRAYVKGINETEDRAMVLHPSTGQFCWISLENVWIDGDIRELTRISDLEPEDYYLPICASSFTPTITGAACPAPAGEDVLGEGFNPYQMQSAVVDKGTITQIFLVPIHGENKLVSNPVDVRISREDFKMETDSFSPPGGMFWVEAEEVKYPCFLTQDQTGNVTCTGLSIDAAGPAELNLCWQGYDDCQECPVGFVSYSGSCVHSSGISSCQPECPPGYQYNELIGSCLVKIAPKLLEDNPLFCPAGMSVSTEIDCCMETSVELSAICPDGYYYQAEFNNCQRLASEGICPEGYSSDPQTGSCYIPATAPSPRCTLLRAEFPVYDVIVREATRCYKYSDNRNEIVGSLTPFTVVKALGLGEDGKTLVIKNPDYQVSCWAFLDAFYTEDLDLGILPVIKD